MHNYEKIRNKINDVHEHQADVKDRNAVCGLRWSALCKCYPPAVSFPLCYSQPTWRHPLGKQWNIMLIKLWSLEAADVYHGTHGHLWMVRFIWPSVTKQHNWGRFLQWDDFSCGHDVLIIKHTQTKILFLRVTYLHLLSLKLNINLNR